MGIELELKGVFSPDIDGLREWAPTRPEDVFYCVQLDIGLAGDDRADIFQALIATPQGLRAHKEKYGPLDRDSRRMLFVFADYSWVDVEKKLTQIVADCAGSDWVQCVDSLRKQFHWEYEDYRG